ncbi:MAG: phage major capsid protein [Propionivibrio sp.]|nr:phage major capsid protein [Propionivibrio sp.]
MELKEVIEDLGESFTSFKKVHKEKVESLSDAICEIEKKLNRPGQPGVSSASTALRAKTTNGADCFLLSKGDRLAGRSDPFASSVVDGDEFDLGSYVKEAICGGRKAMVSGPALVPTRLSDLIVDSVRDLSVVTLAGARTLVIEGPTNLARITGDPTVYQHTEGNDDISESDITLVPMVSNPKLLAAVIPVSEELVQDSPNLDEVIRMAIAAAFAEKLDVQSLAKLLADESILESAAGQDPASWLGVLAAVSDAMAQKQKVPSSLIGAPADFISRSSELASTSGVWLGKPPALSGMSELSTSVISAGTALFGDFAKGVMTAIRSDLRIEVIRWAKTGKAQHAVVAHCRADGYIIQPGVLYRMLKTVA